MSDREALAAALETFVEIAWRPTPIDPGVQYEAAVTVEAAARERLAQLPSECPDEECVNGYIDVDGVPFFHESCHGSGKVYPAELVEKIAKAIHDFEYGDTETWDSQIPLHKDDDRRFAAAVLAALDSQSSGEML